MVGRSVRWLVGWLVEWFFSFRWLVGWLSGWVKSFGNDIFVNHHIIGFDSFCSPSVYEIKNNCSLFETVFKIKKNGVFLFGISFFVLQTLPFLYYAN